MALHEVMQIKSYEEEIRLAESETFRYMIYLLTIHLKSEAHYMFDFLADLPAQSENIRALSACGERL